MGSQLQQLREMTVVVADTGDIDQIGRLRPRDATTNPSLIAQAAAMPAYADVVEEALAYGRAYGSGDEALRRTVDRLAVGFGLRILALIDGRVSTEVDARLSYDARATYERAKVLIDLYEAAKVPRDRVLIKIASTWEGIRAAEELEREGIHCNLTLLFGLHQAVAAAEAGVTLISPFVGRILDWYKKHEGRDYLPHEDPGVLSVKRIYEYYKHFDFATEVMGASFRNAGEIRELSGCDLLTISPALLDELDRTDEPLVRKLNPSAAKEVTVERLAMGASDFERHHAGDAMARDKLTEGIDGFTKALKGLETTLLPRL